MRANIKYIIGISGKAGSGKDTTYEMIKEIMEPLGYRVVRKAFADHLKQLAQKYFPFVDVVKKDPISRQSLQGLGELMRSEVNKNYWAGIVASQIELDEPTQTTIYVITDMRHENEAEIIQRLCDQYDGFLLRVNGRTSLNGDSAKHISETGLDDYPFEKVIENIGSLEDYRKKVIECLKNNLNLFH